MVEISPTGLLLHRWIDSYINVILRQVNCARTGKDVSNVLSEETCIRLFVRSVVAHALDDLEALQDAFVGEVVHDVLEKTRLELGSSENIEDSLNTFAAGYVVGILGEAIRTLSQEALKEKQFLNLADDSELTDPGLDQYSTELVINTLLSIVLEERYKSFVRCRTGTELTASRVKIRTKRKAMTKLDSSQAKRRQWDDKSGKAGKSWKHNNVFGSRSQTSGSRSAGSVDSRFSMGAEDRYIRHRLSRILGKNVDGSIVRFVMESARHHGSWSRMFQVVDNRLMDVEHQSQASHKNLFQFGHPLLVQTSPMPPCSESKASHIKKDISRGVQSGMVCGELQKEKPVKKPSRARRFLLRIRNSILRLGHSSQG